MPDQNDAPVGSDKEPSKTTGKPADDIGRDDPQKVEKLARAGEDTGAVDHEE